MKYLTCKNVFQSAVGFELWSMSPDIYFDNIIITDDEEVAKKWADDSFEIRRVKIAEESVSIFLSIAQITFRHYNNIVLQYKRAYQKRYAKENIV